jgi:hypothetical protein
MKLILKFIFPKVIIIKAILIIFLLQYKVWAVMKPEVGLGVSNNVNYSSSNQKSDEYYWLKNFSDFNFLNYASHFWISYKDFSKESQNDVLNWRFGLQVPNLSTNLSKYIGDSNFDIGVGGQNFTSTNPETTDEGFDNYYFEIDWEKSLFWKENGEFIFVPGYQMSHYDDSSGRLDQKLYFNTTFDFEVRSEMTISPFAELGFIFSSDELYRKNYFDLGLDWNHKLNQDLDLQGSIFNKTSWFPNRAVSTAEIISGVGKFKRSTSQNEIEKQNYTQIEISMIKIFKKLKLKGTIVRAMQNTKSGAENFSELSMQTSLLFEF